jgi:cell division protein FtsI (penicillin-binding protein 3)
MLKRFGFGAPTGIPLSGETSGILRKPQTWSVRTKPTIAFGQELSVSALQIVTAATVFANDGLLLKPLVVKKIVSPDGRLIKEYSREPVTEVLSPEISRSVLRMMETATQPGGTAKRAAIEGYRISGKTGTAQVTDPSTGGYYKDKYIASFLGIFPTEKPRLIIYVSIENPKGEHYYGSRIAAPVFKEAAEALIPLMGITGADANVVAHSGRVVITRPDPLKLEDRIPDLLGQPKRLLIPLLANEDIEVAIRGEGYVVRQSPPPGTPVRKGMRLILELE